MIGNLNNQKQKQRKNKMKTLTVFQKTGEQVWTAPYKNDNSLLSDAISFCQRGFVVQIV